MSEDLEDALIKAANLITLNCPLETQPGDYAECDTNGIVVIRRADGSFVAALPLEDYQQLVADHREPA